MGVRGVPARTRWPVLVVSFVFALLLVPAVGFAFPGTNINESVRSNTPDDPDFDPCEPDNAGGPTCTNVFGQEIERFGFAPSATQNTATYNPLAAPARQVAQNTLAGRTPLGQVSGVSADRAWKYFGELSATGPVGDPEVEVAILDTGIRWGNSELRTKIALNEGELPRPQQAVNTPCPADDCNGDGAFDVRDFANDSRVTPTDGHPSADAFLDASDLLAVFSGDGDGDSNGYPDDIAGWDYFDDDNDPYDASSYSSAAGHGSGRASEAGAATDNNDGGTGVCPACQIVPMRVWDTFVVDTNNFGQAVLYAADNGVEVVEGAVGGLTNSRFVRESFAYAYAHGTIPVIVSSDLNTADHNIPTTFKETMMVQGTVADVHGVGQNPPQNFIDFFTALGVPLGTNAPVGTWFRNSGTTQYGGHAHIVMPAVTGSAATGQASGAAALVMSYARQAGLGSLDPNEVKQLITMTAEDVSPLNTNGLGVPDPAQQGWDQHFGYGRPDLGYALERIRNEDLAVNPGQQIPPQVLITAPDWFAPLNVEDQTQVQVSARLSADRAPLSGGDRYDWELQWAPGIEPCDSDFQTVATGSGATELDGALGTIDLAQVRAALDARTLSTSCPNPPQPVDGGSTPDATAPAKGPGDVDPNEPAFTARVVVTDTQGNVGEDRRTLFAYRDTTLHGGWSRPIGGQPSNSGLATTGGEASQRMYDLDGDNDLELIQATSSGELQVLRDDGTPLPSFNNGNPVTTQLYPNVHAAAAGFGSVAPPREVLRTPAIGDIDGDLEPEIVDSAGEHVYAWNADGSAVPQFPVRIDPALSSPAIRTEENHIKRGFIASPSLGDLVGDGALEIVIPSLDQHVYAWSGGGQPLSGFPVRLREEDSSGDPIPCSGDFQCAEIINTATVGNITGDARPEIIVPTAEFDDNPAAPAPPAGLGGFGGILNNVLANVLGGSGRVYALDAGGDILPGWPTHPNGILPDALPLVGPGVDHALGNVDGDSELEVIGNVATGDVTATDGDGSPAVDYDSVPGGGEHVDKSKVLNLFENPIVADLDGASGVEVLKGGITLNGLVNVGVAVGQNLPYNHVLQSWNGQTGASLPSYPQAVEDYQLLSSPAVADLSPLPGNEAVVGTGLYLIRNVNATGVEAPGWPKFTGGWNFAVPAVGDVDNDGDLEVSSLTREGFSFVWETDSPACADNEESWTSHHDEWSTGAYGTDTRPPGTPEGLAAQRSGSTVTLSFSAPGDDWMCGTASKLRVIASPNPIQHPGDGTQIREEDVSVGAGGAVTLDLTDAELGNAAHVAVLYRDEAGNWGHLADVAVPQAGGGGGGGGEPTPTPEEPTPDPPASAGPCANTIAGTSGADSLTGTDGGDRINGQGGPDKIRGGAGDDCLRGGRGPDRMSGGEGDDKIHVRGGRRDRVTCGPGDDTVVASRTDRVGRSCETVRD